MLKRHFITFFLLFQAYFMLFAPISCNCKQTLFDLSWFIVMMGGIGLFCILERDISKFWTAMFRVTGYISFLFCAMFIVTFNNNLISNYYFNLSIYSVYILSVIYVIIHTLIKKK